MKLIITLLLLAPSYSQASWLSSLCAKYLVAEDPYPYAELNTAMLLDMYVFHRNKDMGRELKFRLNHLLMSDKEAHAIQETIEFIETKAY